MDRKNYLTKPLFLIGLLLVQFVFAQEVRNDVQYIKLYAQYAVEEMHLYKIPASITLAQGLLETAFGQSELAKNANNHFGIKCKKDWLGAIYRYTDDSYKECFRKYNDVHESYRDHSLFLANRPYYSSLFEIDMKDYKAWAHGLKKAGYATNPNYANLLIVRIEKYGLDRFDYLQTDDVERNLKLWYPEDMEIGALEAESIDAQTEVADQLQTIESESTSEDLSDLGLALPSERIKSHPNDNEYIIVMNGETLHSISRMYKTPIEQLMVYNEINKPEELKAGQYLFLKKKKRIANQRYYQVKAGETNLYLIAQKLGMSHKVLLKKNKLKTNSVATPGQWLKTSGKSIRYI